MPPAAERLRVVTMPIEFWWWIEPLFETGMLTLLLCGGVGMILADVMRDSAVPFIIIFVGFLPGVISILSCFAWVIANALFLIWRG